MNQPQRRETPLWAIGDQLVTIVEVRPDYFRYMDTMTDTLLGEGFDGRRLPAAVAYLTARELNQ